VNRHGLLGRFKSARLNRTARVSAAIEPPWRPESTKPRLVAPWAGRRPPAVLYGPKDTKAEKPQQGPGPLAGLDPGRWAHDSMQPGDCRVVERIPQKPEPGRAERSTRSLRRGIGAVPAVPQQERSQQIGEAGGAAATPVRLRRGGPDSCTPSASAASRRARTGGPFLGE